jgi:hypothetical protein
MPDKRKRIYYTKAQITNGLITKGKEWMFKDTTEYIGQYHRYSTDEVFSEPSYVDGKSKILIPYVDVNIINQQNEIGIDFTKNFEYDAIKNIEIKKSITPNPRQINPTDKDRKRGWMERYFAQKVNDDNILELTKDDFDNVGTDDGLDKILWKKFKIRWRLIGNMDDIINTNRQTTLLKSEDYPSLNDYITDFREFS